MRPPAALIVGGGPAGAAAATVLARAGHRPLLLERDRDLGDALCGGFLSWATLRRLGALGLDLDRLAARPVERVALFAGRRVARARLPAQAGGVSRARLDGQLIALAEAAGGGVERGVAVRALDRDGVTLADGTRLDGGAVLLATGKHDLRGHPRPQPHRDPAIGLRWRLGTNAALDRLVDGSIELHLFRGGYAGLVRQENDVNLCMALRRSRLRDAEGSPERLLAELAIECPMLGERLGLAASLGAAQAVANVPYGWRTAAVDGPYRVGDQAGVIPSLAGEGLAIAVASGAAAAEAITQGKPAVVFHRRLAAGQRRPITAASLLWHLAENPAGARAMVGAVSALPVLARLAARITRV